jgi:pimeloyl-ACP methyl ester carboxylesterase
MSRRQPRKRRYRLMGLAALVAVSPALIGSLWGWVSAHPPRTRRPLDETPALWAIHYENVTLSTADGLRLAAWYTPPKRSAVILVGHGYANGRLVEMHTLFARHGYGVLSWDFRAHGRSQGHLCTVGYYEVRDVEAALDFALAQPSVEWVGMWGGSMGGIAAIGAASRRPEIRAIVADSVPSTLHGALQVYVRPRILQPFFRYFVERESGLSVDLVRPVDQIADISPRPLFITRGRPTATSRPNPLRTCTPRPANRASCG